MRSLIVTTSWDDGHSLDMRLAGILDKYNIRGTFYITKNYLKMRLTDTEIVELSKRHEIGAHTITHPVLPEIPLLEAEREIHESKLWLENLLGSEVSMFCYPYGCYDESIVNAVRKAGFRGARTVKMFRIARPSNPYEMNTTVHVQPLALAVQRSRLGFTWPLFLSLLVRRRPSSPLRSSLPPLDWRGLARSIFDFSLRSGGVFHLYGHSWVVEKFDMWEDLENVLEYISGRRRLHLCN